MPDMEHLPSAIDQARRYGAQVRYAEDYETYTPAIGARSCDFGRVGARRAFAMFLEQFPRGSLMREVVRGAYMEEYCR